MRRGDWLGSEKGRVIDHVQPAHSERVKNDFEKTLLMTLCGRARAAPSCGVSAHTFSVAASVKHLTSV